MKIFYPQSWVPWIPIQKVETILIGHLVASVGSLGSCPGKELFSVFKVSD